MSTLVGFVTRTLDYTSREYDAREGIGKDMPGGWRCHENERHVNHGMGG